MHRRGHYYANTVDQGFQPEIIDTLIEQGLPFSSPFRSSRCITFMEPRAASVRRKLLFADDHLMVELLQPGSHRTTSSGISNGHKTSQALAPMPERGYISPGSGRTGARSACLWSNYERLLDLNRNTIQMMFDRRSDISHNSLTR